MNNAKLAAILPSILVDMSPSGVFHGWPLSDVVDYVLEGHDDLSAADGDALLRLLEDNC